MTVLFLASQSPRRRELLAQIGVGFKLLPVDVDESRVDGEPALEYVQRVAADKASAGYAAMAAGNSETGRDAKAVVLAADTTVYIDEAPIGKPANPEQAADILGKLSGRWHSVATAVALAGSDGGQLATALSVSEVRFKTLTAGEIDAYCGTDEPYDKAGAYAVQGLAALFIEALRGSYTGIMGLPLYETGRLLRDAGVETGLQR